MSYLVFCTFDLEGASEKDYQNAYADLESIGLKKVVVGGSGKNVVIPTTSAMGELDGSSAAALRDDIRSRIKDAFKARGLKSEIFLIVGDNWTWGSTTT